MNKLEKVILDATEEAQKRYEKMTGGWWLSHGPELYLQGVIAEKIHGLGHSVYIDCSVKRIKAEIGRGPGRPRKDEGKRPDISVWNKTSDTLRAVIEVKRAYSSTLVKKDIEKMSRQLTSAGFSNTAYLLAYSERKLSDGKTLKDRFNKWSGDNNWTLVGHTKEISDGDAYVWSAALLRAPKTPA